MIGKLWTAAICLAAVAVLAPAALAEATAATKPAAAEKKDEGEKAKAADFGFGKGLAAVGICIGAAICVLAGGTAIGKVGSATLESIARQPEAAGQMFTPMIVACAMIEGGMFFGIVITLLGILKL
jgi:F-type H+-transporting ATPase subunit c